MADDVGTGAGSGFDAVITQMTQRHVSMLGCLGVEDGPVTRWASRRPAPVGMVVGTARVLWALARAVRQGRKGFGGAEPSDTYRAVTGVGRDRAIDDMALVDRRMLYLIPAAARLHEDDPDARRALLAGAVDRLVRWVAAGRPVDEVVTPTEEAYERLMLAHEGPDAGRAAATDAALQEYGEAWRATLGL